MKNLAKNWKKLNSLSPLEIFEQRVYPHIVEERGECWLVKGLKDNGHGYVAIRVLHDGVSHFYYVHRLAYELFVGEIPDGIWKFAISVIPQTVLTQSIYFWERKKII
jgi:hypothetical protein